jgi:hypothetical protein
MIGNRARFNETKSERGERIECYTIFVKTRCQTYGIGEGQTKTLQLTERSALEMFTQ